MEKISTGRNLLANIIKSENIKYIFGNPGTTELAFMEEIGKFKNFKYILALQEAIVVSIADGFSRVKGDLSFVNLHAAPGLGNAIGSIYNAKVAGSPIIITAGQQELGHGIKEPLLYHDLVSIASPVVKWAYEIRNVDEIEIVFRRAAKIALTPPTGPVFVSLPGDILDEKCYPMNSKPTRISFDYKPTEKLLREVYECINQAKSPIVIAGYEIGLRNSFDEAEKFAKKIGAPVWQHTVPRAASFKSSNELFVGTLPRNQPLTNSIIQDHDLVIAIGCDLLSMSVISHINEIPPGIKIIHISERDWELGKNHAVDLAINLNVQKFLECFNQSKFKFSEKFNSRKLKRESKIKKDNWSTKREKLLSKIKDEKNFPISVEFFNKFIGLHLPKKSVVVEEGLSSTFDLPKFLEFNTPDSYYGLTSGGIGFAMGGAIGICLALEKKPVIALIGDGSSMYSIQSLWTASHLNLPITYLIINNNSYQILKQRMLNFRGSKKFTGMDLDKPIISFDSISSSFDINFKEPENCEELMRILQNHNMQKKPQLVNIPIKRKI